MSAGTASSSSSLSAYRVGENEHNKLDRRGFDGASDSLAAWVCMRAENYVQRLTLTTSSSPKPSAVSPSEVLQLFRQRTRAAKFFSKLSSDLDSHHELWRKAREGAFCGRAGRLKAAEVNGHERSRPTDADLCKVPVTWYPIARDQSADVADGETLHNDNPLHFRYPDSFIGFTLASHQDRQMQNGDERKFEHFRFSSRCSMREDWAPLRRSLCQDQVLAYYLSAAASPLSALPVASNSKRPPSKSKNKTSTSTSLVVSKTKSRRRSKGTVGSESSRAEAAEGVGARVGEADVPSGSATSEVQENENNDEPAKRCPRLLPKILEHIAEFLDPVAEVLYCPEYYCRLATSKVRATLAPAFREVLSFCYDRVATKGVAKAQVRLTLPLAANERRTRIEVLVADEEEDQGNVGLLGELAPARAPSAIHCEVDIKGDAFNFHHWNACRSEDWANDLSRWKQKYPDIVTEKCISESSCLATLPERFIASMMHEYFSQERGMKVTIDSDDFRKITLSWG